MGSLCCGGDGELRAHFGRVPGRWRASWVLHPREAPEAEREVPGGRTEALGPVLMLQ